jgi:nucleotide-binding universal stress UspA family protein
MAPPVVRSGSALVFATVVWASDGSETADGVLGWVTRFASGERATLWVVHVAQRGDGATKALGEYEETVIAKLKTQVRELRDLGFAASLYVIRGACVPVGTAIDAAARAIGADLLVLGAGGRPPADTRAPSGVAHQVLAAASYPVLSLPPPVTWTPAPAAAPP